MANIFISYSQMDCQRVEPLVDTLTAEGYEVWWDLKIGCGESFYEPIETTLGKVWGVVTVWSQHSVASEGGTCGVGLGERSGKIRFYPNRRRYQASPEVLQCSHLRPSRLDRCSERRCVPKSADGHRQDRRSRTCTKGPGTTNSEC